MNYLINECSTCNKCYINSTCKKCRDPVLKGYKNEPILISYDSNMKVNELKIIKIKHLFKEGLRSEIDQILGRKNETI